jgi:predicted secreted hydrolase
LLFLVCPLSQGQIKRKNQLCGICASSEAGGEINQTYQSVIHIIAMKEIIRISMLFKLWLSIIIAAAVSFAMEPDQSGYLPVTGPCNLEFPKDHGPHPGYRTEWWYYTGNLTSEKGNRYGFQFTIFRTQISPPGYEQKWPQPSSAWRTQQIFLGHAAISDISGKRHLQAETLARNALGMAGGIPTDGQTDIFIKNWSLQIRAEQHFLNVTTDDFSYELTLEPLKPPVLHGDTGYSRKGATGGQPETLEGLSWMDHEFSTTALEPGLAGWDWFSLQLSDNTDIMFYLLRKGDGQLSPMSGGTFVDAAGTVRHLELENDDFKVDILKTWKSPQSNAVYPAQWRAQIRPFSIDVTISPNLADQEMQTFQSTGVTYWEGSVSLKGIKNGQPVEGSGYVELTGYDRSFDAPM